jgi:hypothetical protein
MDRRTPLALLETHGRLITEATYFPSLLEGCAAQTLSASGLQAPVSNVRFGSILLKNSFSTDDGKVLGVIRREARFRLGIHERVDVAM